MLFLRFHCSNNNAVVVISPEGYLLQVEILDSRDTVHRERNLCYSDRVKVHELIPT